MWNLHFVDLPCTDSILCASFFIPRSSAQGGDRRRRRHEFHEQRCRRWRREASLPRWNPHGHPVATEDLRDFRDFRDFRDLAKHGISMIIAKIIWTMMKDVKFCCVSERIFWTFNDFSWSFCVSLLLHCDIQRALVSMICCVFSFGSVFSCEWMAAHNEAVTELPQFH